MATKASPTSVDNPWAGYDGLEADSEMDEEGKSAVKFHLNKNTNKKQRAQFAKELEKIQEYSKDGKLYELLALDLPDIATDASQFQSYKEAIKVALKAYLFLKKWVTSSTAGNNSYFGLLKITGQDFTNMQASPVLSAAPYGIMHSSLFKITPVAAKALCMVIAEIREIDALIITSAKNDQEKKEFEEAIESDEGLLDVLTRLANHHPRDTQATKWREDILIGAFMKVLAENDEAEFDRILQVAFASPTIARLLFEALLRYSRWKAKEVAHA